MGISRPTNQPCWTAIYKQSMETGFMQTIGVSSPGGLQMTTSRRSGRRTSCSSHRSATMNQGGMWVNALSAHCPHI